MKQLAAEMERATMAPDYEVGLQRTQTVNENI